MAYEFQPKLPFWVTFQVGWDVGITPYIFTIKLFNKIKTNAKKKLKRKLNHKVLSCKKHQYIILLLEKYDNKNIIFI